MQHSGSSVSGEILAMFMAPAQNLGIQPNTIASPLMMRSLFDPPSYPVLKLCEQKSMLLPKFADTLAYFNAVSSKLLPKTITNEWRKSTGVTKHHLLQIIVLTSTKNDGPGQLRCVPC